jgi:pimeloyl-ACP methyl ester carboxylesterase
LCLADYVCAPHADALSGEQCAPSVAAEAVPRDFVDPVAGGRSLPFVRGYGTTRVRSNETFRNGEQAAPAVDVVAFMEALGIDSAILAGFD